ncbi:MAG: helix-turn-helix domain-containing protein [Oscillospiraceae bacterium]
MYGLSPVATSSKVLEYQGKSGFFQPNTDLRLAAGMTTNMIANMSKEGKHISMDTLARICETLNCEITDVIELVPDEPASTGGKEHERIETKNNGKRN